MYIKTTKPSTSSVSPAEIDPTHNFRRYGHIHKDLMGRACDMKQLLLESNQMVKIFIHNSLMFR